MLQSSSEFNNLGAGNGIGPGGWGGLGFGGGGGWGGLGGFGLIGLLGIGDLLNRRGHDGFGDGFRHRDGGDDCCESNKQAVLLAAIGNAKDTSVAEARALSAQVCELEKTDMQQFYAAAIQAANNTQSIKDQASAIAIVADKRFDDLSAQQAAGTAAVLARINQAEVDNLRDQLFLERRRSDAKEVEISINNTANATAMQMQLQSQRQMQDMNDLHRRFDFFGNQIAKNSQDIINVGGALIGASQTANPTNIK